MSRTEADFLSNGFNHSEFLKTVTYGNFKFRDHVMDWRYEERRTGQEILPFIHLGPLSAAKDREYLLRNGITLVMAVRNLSSAYARLLNPRTATNLGLETYSIDVASNQQLIAAFPRAIDAINKHLTERYQKQQLHNRTEQQRNPQQDRHQHQQGQHDPAESSPEVPSDSPSNHFGLPGKVLVFCESGNERSAAFVVAYIMAMYATNLVEALQVVQSQRFCVSLDDGLRFLLKTYEDMLSAKRDVVRSVAGSQRSNEGTENSSAVLPTLMLPPRREKRSIDEAYENDVEMTEDREEGVERGLDTVKRNGVAPFAD